MALLLAFWKLLVLNILLVIIGAIGAHRFILRLYPAGETIQEYEEP